MVIYPQGLCQFKDKIVRFRMSRNVHKFPWKRRQIVYCVGASMNCLSKWLDYWLQQLKPFISTYIKDSAQLLARIKKKLEHFPKLLAIYRRSNINVNQHWHPTRHPSLNLWLDSLTLPKGFPLEMLKEVMALVVVSNNIVFSKLLGTAMGTSGACMWATIYFAVRDMGTLIPDCGTHLPLFLCFIDNIIGITA